MFTVMIWMRDIFGKCPLSGFAGRMRQQCKSQDLHIGRALWCHQVDFAELLSTLAATWTNLWIYWIILVQTRKSGLYYDVANQCTQLVSSFFIGWKYWASNPSACSEDICQVFLKKQRICWMLPPFLWVQLVPGRRPSCATLPWTWHRGFRCHELDMLLYYTHILYSCMFIQPTRILQVYAPKILWKLLVAAGLGCWLSRSLSRPSSPPFRSCLCCFLWCSEPSAKIAWSHWWPSSRGGWGWSLGPIWGVFFNSESKGILAICIAICAVFRSLLPSSLIHMKLCKQGEYAKKPVFGCFVLYGASCASWWRPLCMSIRAHELPGIWLAPLSRLHLPWCFRGKSKSGRCILMLLQRFAVWGKLDSRDAPCTTVQPPNRQLCRDKALAWIARREVTRCTTWWRLCAVKRQIFCNLPDQTA